jgi:hypothetical protein
MDAGSGIGCGGAGYAYSLAMLPSIQARLTMSNIGVGAHCCVGFWDSAGDGWGVEYDKAVSSKWQIRVTTGGVSQLTDVELATTSEVTVKVWLTGTVGAQTVHAIVGTHSAVYSATQPTNAPEKPRVYSIGTGPVAATLSIDYVRIEAHRQ